MKQEVKIIFEDNHLLIVEKPVNIPTQADESGDPDLLTLLKSDLKKRYQKPGNVYLGLVHRLDRPVGGVMVFAKTSKAAARLAEQVRNREFAKSYLAVIHGTPACPVGELEHHLIKDRVQNKVAVVPAGSEAARLARLQYELISSKDNLSLVKIRLETGRSHQIRVQFAAIGHSLYGDQKYGAMVNTPGQQIALWSTGLSFIHPTKQELMSFQSLPPAVFPWTIFGSH